MDKEQQRDFFKIQQAIEGRISFLDTLSYSEEIKRNRKEELFIMLKVVNKVRQYSLKPLKAIATVGGTKYKIGDLFRIPGDEVTDYKIVLFPNEVTIRGVATYAKIGKPYTCEVYVELARKVEKKKEKVKKEKKHKKIRIEAGEYFSIRTDNTIYKALITTNKTVEGVNKLTAKNAPKRVKVSLRDICIKTKKDYKNQHKAERNYKK